MMEDSSGGASAKPGHLHLRTLLERLLQTHRDHAAEQALENVAGTRETTAGGDLVLIG